MYFFSFFIVPEVQMPLLEAHSADGASGPSAHSLYHHGNKMGRAPQCADSPEEDEVDNDDSATSDSSDTTDFNDVSDFLVCVDVYGVGWFALCNVAHCNCMST